jgi:hypothetical protein
MRREPFLPVKDLAGGRALDAAGRRRKGEALLSISAPVDRRFWVRATMASKDRLPPRRAPAPPATAAAAPRDGGGLGLLMAWVWYPCSCPDPTPKKRKPTPGEAERR